MPRARWAVAPNGRMAHRWRESAYTEGLDRRYEFVEMDCNPTIVRWLGLSMKPPGNAPRCKRCERAAKRRKHA